MDKTKFYTPESDEFCIGATYYMPVLDDDLKETDQYLAINIQSFNFFSELLGDQWDFYDERISPPKTSVMKYLDKEDIESCGFKYDDFPNPHYYWFGSTDNDGELNITLYFNDLQNIIIDNEQGSYSFRLFDGKIKNLCEFKKLLKQLGI